ncbi:MAG: tryptophan tryptophylquinone biosynthesis enzyme MauG [Hyphomicrobiales bacterium]|nr:MAG: tryptophan tryptophylquinone biosynthesis enzyme MauG [Hyphomicrobiales bacterium]
MDELKKYKRPLTIPFDGVTPYSIQLATLGKMLFFDPRLSGAKNMSCASCHNPSFGYETPVDLVVGANNSTVDRHVPTLLNMAWVSPHFWDGRSKSLEEQAVGPITSPIEMNGNFKTIISEFRMIPDYVKWFNIVFPEDGVTQKNILTALATYERTIVSGWSPFDRWVDGNEHAISLGAKRGFELFTGKAGCSNCHTGWNFTDNSFHDTGLNTSDIGRAKYEPDNLKAMHAFKTPGLRNTIFRAPYMHNGSLPTLRRVITHYEVGGIKRTSRSRKMEHFSLTNGERNDLVSFIKTLTAEKQEASLPVLPN